MVTCNYNVKGVLKSEIILPQSERQRKKKKIKAIQILHLMWGILLLWQGNKCFPIFGERCSQIDFIFQINRKAKYIKKINKTHESTEKGKNDKTDKHETQSRYLR